MTSSSAGPARPYAACMAAPLTVDDWPLAPIRTARLVLRAPEARDRGRCSIASARTTRSTAYARRADASRAELEARAARPCRPTVPARARWSSTTRRLPSRWVGLGRATPTVRAGPRRGRGADLDASALHHTRVRAPARSRRPASPRPRPRPAGSRGPTSSARRARVLCTQGANARSLALAERLGFTEVARFEEFGAEQCGAAPGTRRCHSSRRLAGRRRAAASRFGRVRRAAYADEVPMTDPCARSRPRSTGHRRPRAVAAVFARQQERSDGRVLVEASRPGEGCCWTTSRCCRRTTDRASDARCRAWPSAAPRRRAHPDPALHPRDDGREPAAVRAHRLRRDAPHDRARLHAGVLRETLRRQPTISSARSATATSRRRCGSVATGPRIRCSLPTR